MKLATWVIGLALPLAMHTAFAANSTPPPVVDPSLIEGSYFITFTDPVGTEKPILDPPGKLKAAEVTFGEHTSGQSKQALEKALRLNGKIMRIFDTLSGIRISILFTAPRTQHDRNKTFNHRPRYIIVHAA